MAGEMLLVPNMLPAQHRTIFSTQQYLQQIYTDLPHRQDFRQPCSFPAFWAETRELRKVLADSSFAGGEFRWLCCFDAPKRCGFAEPEACCCRRTRPDEKASWDAAAARDAWSAASAFEGG